MADLTALNYWPLGSTVQKSSFSVEHTAYRHFGFISVNPINGHLIVVYRVATNHVGSNGIICIKHSIDGGINWDRETTIFDNTDINIDLRNLGGGYDSTGKLFVFYISKNMLDDTKTKMICNYSIDDGKNWIHEQTLTTNGDLTSFNPYGQLTDIGDGILFQTWYDNTGIHIYKSENGGQSFDIIITLTSSYGYNESSMVHIGGGCFILLARTADPNIFAQFKSEDYGDNWTFHDIVNFGNSTGWASPPWLSVINFEGVGIVACYYTDRNVSPPTLNVVFGLAKNLLNGVAGWNKNNQKTIDNVYTGGDDVSGYQSIFLPFNQYKGIGISFIELTLTGKAYPFVFFTNISGMFSIFTSLGL